MTAQPYPTDLSDAEWRILAPLLKPLTRRGRPRKHDRRVVVNAVLYVLRGGVPWRLLPHEYPPCRSVYDQFSRWRQTGLWCRINAALRSCARALLGRASPSRIAIIDSQTARTSEAGGERGYDGGKPMSGCKRHLVVESQGLVLHVCDHRADIHDRRAAEIVLTGLNAAYPDIERLFGDMAYQGLAAWLSRNRRLARDWEKLPSTTETWIYLAMSRLMAKRLAHATD